MTGRSEEGTAMALDTAQLAEMMRAMIHIREFDELAIKWGVAGRI